MRDNEITRTRQDIKRIKLIPMSGKNTNFAMKMRPTRTTTPDLNADNDTPGKSCNSLTLFLKLLLSPNNGWRKLRACCVNPADFERSLFYPLLALTAVLQFLALIYNPHIPIASILQRAIMGFVSMFASYFAILAISRSLMPPKASEKAQTPFFRVFAAASLSVLDTGYMLSLIAPQARVLLWFGFIYTLNIVCRGVKFLHLPHKERMPASIVACILTVGLPIAIYTLFSILMPSI